jgi:LacI family transcriptional regulator
MSNKSGKITLKDLAQLTGVSATAISHILNDRLGHVRASIATQQRVLSAAKEHGYVPRLQARSMATRRSYAIGAVCFIRSGPQDPYTASYFANALCGVEQVCRSANHHCVFVASESDHPDDFEEPRLMKDGAVDGVVLIGLSNRRVAAKLLRMGLPCVQVGSNIDPSLGISSVSGDLDSAVETICRRLVAMGHRRIDFALPVGPGSAKHLRHFAALNDRIAGMKPRATTVPETVMTPDIGRALAQAALAVPASLAPTAYILPIRAASGFLAGMAAAGRTFPKDYSIVAVAPEEMESPVMGVEQRALTTIVLPTLNVARRATVALFGRLGVSVIGSPSPAEPPPADGIKLPCTIRNGESIGQWVGAS